MISWSNMGKKSIENKDRQNIKEKNLLDEDLIDDNNDEEINFLYEWMEGVMAENGDCEQHKMKRSIGSHPHMFINANLISLQTLIREIKNNFQKYKIL